MLDERSVGSKGIITKIRYTLAILQMYSRMMKYICSLILGHRGRLSCNTNIYFIAT